MRKKQIKVEEETLLIRTFLRQIQAQTKSASQISPHFAHDLTHQNETKCSQQHQNNKKGKSKK